LNLTSISLPPPETLLPLSHIPEKIMLPERKLCARPNRERTRAVKREEISTWASFAAADPKRERELTGCPK